MSKKKPAPAPKQVISPRAWEVAALEMMDRVRKEDGSELTRADADALVSLGFKLVDPIVPPHRGMALENFLRDQRLARSFIQEPAMIKYPTSAACYLDAVIKGAESVQ